MAFDQNNYVAPAPGGGFVSVVNGVEQRFPTQSAAEQNFNERSGQSNAPSGGGGGQTYPTPNGPRTIDQMRSELAGAGYNGPTDPASIIAAYNRTSSGGGGGGGFGGFGDFGFGDLINANLESNRERWEFEKRMAEEQLRLAQNADQRAAAQLRLQRAEFELQRINSAAQLGTNLISLGAQLRGPEDYFQFLTATSQGRDLFNQLFGNQPRAEFGAPQGEMQPASIESLMNRLGIDLSGMGSGAIDAVLTDLPADWYDKMLAWHRSVIQQTGQRPTPDQWGQMFSLLTGLSPEVGKQVYTRSIEYRNAFPNEAAVPREAQERFIREAMRAGGTSPGGAPAAAQPGAGQMSLLGQNIAQAATQPQTGLTVPGTGQVVPFAHQVNPGVFDALGPVGQGLLRSAVESSGFDWSEYLRQLNAARPQGTAPRRVTTQFAMPQGIFG